jgi:hypothetical protein
MEKTPLAYLSCQRNRNHPLLFIEKGRLNKPTYMHISFSVTAWLAYSKKISTTAKMTRRPKLNRAYQVTFQA